MSRGDEVGARAGVALTNLDQALFDGAGATKRNLVYYLDAVRDQILPGLRDRPLSVVRVRPGQQPFVQKNVPTSVPDWVRTTTVWAEASRRHVTYALCDDRRTLLWFANQRAVEYHPSLVRDGSTSSTHMVLDLDPPAGAPFSAVVPVAWLVRRALGEAGLAGALKTSGSKGVHVFVPLEGATAIEAVAAATRAVAARVERLGRDIATTAFVRAERGGKVFVDSTRSGAATVVAVYSPRVRPGAPVSFPIAWEQLDEVVPADFTILNAAARLAGGDPW